MLVYSQLDVHILLMRATFDHCAVKKTTFFNVRPLTVHLKALQTQGGKTINNCQWCCITIWSFIYLVALLFSL